MFTITNTNELRQDLHKAFITWNDAGFKPDPWLATFGFPDEWFKRHGSERVWQTAEAMFREELPKLSKQFGGLFGKFNRRYFGGRLPKYRVQVRYAVRLDRSPVDWRGRAIRIPASSEPLMVARLLAGMARIATKRTNPTAYQKELFRLQEAGAPVWVPGALRELPADGFIKAFGKMIGHGRKAAQQGSRGWFGWRLSPQEHGGAELVAKSKAAA